MLLDVEDWKRMVARDVPPRVATHLRLRPRPFPIWSAAVAVWCNGRVEALALAPGIPDLEAQEKRDRVPKGQYNGWWTVGS